MGWDDLTVGILQNVGKRSVQNAGASSGKPGGMIAELWTTATSLHTNHLDLLVFNEIVEEPNGIAATPNASHHNVGQPSFFLQDLYTDFAANDRLKIANH